MFYPRRVRIYLHRSLLSRAEAGQHNFIALMHRVLERAGFDLAFLPEKTRPTLGNGLSLVHMKPPIGSHGLTFRRVYHYPFWQIERTEKRWDWEVARTPFDPDKVDIARAQRFQTAWRRRLYGGDEAPAPSDGYVYVPLQGRLVEHRSFQSMSPLHMLETTLSNDTGRWIVATLHPRETYQQTEIDAFKRLARAHPRLRLDTTGSSADHLRRCAYVVTQNSSVAFDGFLFDRPAILFAQIDFHHIAQNVIQIGAEEAFSRVLIERPDFARYVHWFWQDQSINAGRPEAEEKIAARFRSLGWPV